VSGIEDVTRAKARRAIWEQSGDMPRLERDAGVINLNIDEKHSALLVRLSTGPKAIAKWYWQMGDAKQKSTA